MFQHPLHKRLISRAVFYSGVFLFLWLLDHSQGEELRPEAPPTAVQVDCR